MNTNPLDPEEVLLAAARIADLNVQRAEMIRDGSNVLYRLPDGIVARIGQAGTGAIAEREVRVSRWLETCAAPVVRALAGVPQPVMVSDRPITWWRLLPAHRPATPGELGAVLRTLQDRKSVV